MDSKTWQRLEALFFGALDRPAEERDAWLDEACEGDAALRAEVEALLAANDDTGGQAMRIEGTLLCEGEPPSPSHDARPGDRAGVWRLVRPLGRGGMGEVWLAERADGSFRQEAAVKLMRAGWRASELVTRFRHERQLLARLSHPNIATLLDGGVTERGVPFLAMEYVDGEPIVEWCARRSLPVRDRLALFRTVCNTVRFAHANLVVHRDLKSANILVTEDGRPVLLDFGIAKLLDDGADVAPATRAEDRLLTPEVAAPEQLRGDPVTTATDVWALGLLLFELLAGKRPYDVAGKDTPAIARAVADAPPPRPSDVAGTPALRRALRGDLDNIVRAALRRDPAQRYRSAEQLGDDVGRHLDGLPVQARGDSLPYRAGKFARRHAAALAAATVFAALLIAFAVSSVRQARTIAAERDRAVAAQAGSDKVAGVLVDLFHLSNPRVRPGGDTLRVADLLEVGEEKTDELGDEPAVQAKLWETFAVLHAARSRYREERALLDRAIDAAERAGLDADVLRLRHRRALNAATLDGNEAAEPLLRESLAAHEARLGPDHPDVAIALQNLAGVVADPDERRALLQRALSIVRATAPDDPIAIASAHNALGIHHWRQREFADARDAFAESARQLERIHPSDHPDLLSVRGNVAVCRQALGDFEGSLGEYRGILAARRRVMGNGTMEVASALQNVGVALVNLGRYDEAAPVLREALDTYAAILGPEHADLSGSMQDLGIALARGGRAEEGLALADSGLALAIRTGGDAHASMVNVWTLRLALGRPADMDAMRAAMAALAASHAPDESPLRDVRGALAMATVLRAGRGGAADRVGDGANDGTDPAGTIDALQRMLDSVADLPEGHPRLAHARCLLALARHDAGVPVDRAALRRDLERCERWGLAQPGAIAGVRALLTGGDGAGAAGVTRRPDAGGQAGDG